MQSQLTLSSFLKCGSFNLQELVTSSAMPSKQKDWKRSTKRFLNRRVRITEWLPEYNRDKFVCDLIAGVTVGLTVMPQALAYATLAGLEPQVISDFIELNLAYYCLFKDLTPKLVLI